MPHPPTQTTEDWLASHAPHGTPLAQNGPWHPDQHLVWLICDCGHRHGTTNDKLPLEMQIAERPREQEIVGVRVELVGHATPEEQERAVRRLSPQHQLEYAAARERERIAEEMNQEDEARLLAGEEVD